MDLEHLQPRDLFTLFSRILVEMRRRGILRSTNNPVADYAEWLVCSALSLELAQKSSRYDAKDSQGRRYEIKGRRLTRQNPSRQLSAIRDLDAKHFDFLAGVLFAEDFTVQKACLIPHEVVARFAIFQEHVRASRLLLRDSLWSEAGVLDITGKVSEIQRASTTLVTAPAVTGRRDL